MTGYGHGVGRTDGISVEVEISSINRRQLDVQCSISRALQVLESRILEEIGASVRRGRIALNVRTRPGPNGTAARIRIREDVAGAYIRALRAAGRRLGLPDDLKASALAAWPEAMEISRPEEHAAAAWPAVRDGLRQALAQLIRMREAEGRTLARDLARRLDRLRGMLDRIRARVPMAVSRYRRTLLSRLREAGLDLAGADDRLLREVAVFAERTDISEEITRLDSHLAQFRGRLGRRGAQGRALDFLAQEMLREINTLMSKTGDSVSLRHAIGFKAELESLREQTQNIE